METIVIILAIMLFIILLVSKDDNTSLEELEQELDISYNDRFHSKEEPRFYHPVTGYKGTKSEMDAYIINRERKLRDETN